MSRLLILASLVLAAGSLPSVCTAQAPVLEPILRVEDITASSNIFSVASSSRPLVIKDRETAAKHFKTQNLKTLTDKVKFAQQVVLVFAWRGSGQDRLQFDVLESYPEQIHFKLKRGRTRDLRPHVEVFALRSNVRWRTDDPKAGTSHAKPGQPNDKPLPDVVEVRIRGQLTTGVFAIGGETTGTTITANNITLELDLADSRRLMRKIEPLNGQQVTVSGRLTVKKGVEIRRRWIVLVSDIQPASAEQTD